jgi:SPP1 family predicted phage head-tail adaptor
LNAGDLDRRITIRRFTVVGDDGFGNTISDWADVATVWAQVQQQSGREFFAQGAVQSDTLVVFRMRWLDGVTIQDRVRYKGTDHEVHEVKEVGRRDGL